MLEDDADHYYGSVTVDEAIHFMETQDDVKHDAAVRPNPSFENFHGPYPDWMKIGSEDSVQFLEHLNSLESEDDVQIPHPESMLENRGKQPFEYELVLWPEEVSSTIVNNGAGEKASLKYGLIVYGTRDELPHNGPVPVYSLSGYETEFLPSPQVDERVEAYLGSPDTV